MSRACLLSFVGIPIAAAAFLPVSQASAPGNELAADLVAAELRERCNRATEVRYRSQQLTSLDESTQVHIEGMVRKIVNNPAERMRRGIVCHADIAETLQADVVVTRNNRTTHIAAIEPYKGGYVHLLPISFSLDGRYVAISFDTHFPLSTINSSVVLLDLDTEQFVDVVDACEGMLDSDYDAVNYIGFSAEDEAVIRCQSSARGEPTTSRREIISLPSGEVRPYTSRLSLYGNYGSVSDSARVTNVQRFD